MDFINEQPIKETITFRQKDLDDYLSNMKKLLISKKEINDTLTILKKDLRDVEREINKRNKFLINTKEV